MERSLIVFNALDTKDSLDEAMEAAGGARMSVKHLRSMSALELLDLLSTNKIRFRYTGKSKNRKLQASIDASKVRSEVW